MSMLKRLLAGVDSRRVGLWRLVRPLLLIEVIGLVDPFTFGAPDAPALAGVSPLSCRWLAPTSGRFPPLPSPRRWPSRLTSRCLGFACLALHFLAVHSPGSNRIALLGSTVTLHFAPLHLVSCCVPVRFLGFVPRHVPVAGRTGILFRAVPFRVALFRAAIFRVVRFPVVFGQFVR